MPRGPRGENRPADMISAAVMVARIATDEIEDTRAEKNPHAADKQLVKMERVKRKNKALEM